MVLLVLILFYWLCLFETCDQFGDVFLYHRSLQPDPMDSWHQKKQDIEDGMVSTDSRTRQQVTEASWGWRWSLITNWRTRCSDHEDDDEKTSFPLTSENLKQHVGVHWASHFPGSSALAGDNVGMHDIGLSEICPLTDRRASQLVNSVQVAAIWL